MTRRIILRSEAAKDLACSIVLQAPYGYVCEVREQTRSDDQNRKLHAMVEDLRQQIEGGDQYTKEDWKLRLMNALRNEVRFLPELEGAGQFPVGQKTSELSRTQFSALIEIIYEYGSRRGVQWSGPAERVFAEYGHGRKAA